MAERRVTSVLSQTTLGGEPALDPPEPPPESPIPPSSPDPPPRPVLYPAAAPSSVALHERQLRWLRERDRRRTATGPIAGKGDR